MNREENSSRSLNNAFRVTTQPGLGEINRVVSKRQFQGVHLRIRIFE